MPLNKRTRKSWRVREKLTGPSKRRLPSGSLPLSQRPETTRNGDGKT